jgi:hypothetical protein
VTKEEEGRRNESLQPEQDQVLDRDLKKVTESTSSLIEPNNGADSKLFNNVQPISVGV